MSPETHAVLCYLLSVVVAGAIVTAWVRPWLDREDGAWLGPRELTVLTAVLWPFILGLLVLWGLAWLVERAVRWCVER